MAVAGLGLVKVPRLLRAIEAPRSLAFRHLHTGESLAVEYFAQGDYVPHALSEVNHVLRDWRTNQTYPIDPALLDLLNDLHRVSGTQQPLAVS